MIRQKKTKQEQTYGHLHHAPMPVLIASGEHLTVEYANEKGLSQLRSGPDQVEGTSLHVLLPGVFSLETVKEIYDTCILRGSREVLHDKQVILSDGGDPKMLWYNIDINPIRDHQGTPVSVIMFFSDVTDQVITKKYKNQRAEHAGIERLHDSQEVLQQLLDSSIEFIAVLDRDLKVLVVNKPLENFINKPRQELIGKHIFDAYEGVRSSGQLGAIERAMAGESVRFRAHQSVSRPNMWFDTHYVPLMINGRVEGVIALVRDISDIVKSQQEFANVNRQLAEAQRLAKLGSWEWDVATGNVLWSDEMYRIYGYDNRFPVDFVRATERMSPQDAESSSRRTQQHIQNAIDNFNRTSDLFYEIPSIEFAIKLPNGDQKLVRNSGKIQLTPDGKLYRILGVVQDVTEIRSAEEKLRVLVDELEFKNKELESFNYVASHDLQEPLRKIQSFIDRIRNVPVNQKTLEDYLLRIDNSARRMHDLIQSMLTLSRLSNTTDGFTEVDLNTVLSNCQNDFELVIKEKNAVIECHHLPVIVGSAFQMSQLFGNLISNALKFSKSRPVIRITCKKVPGSELGQHKPDAAREYWCLSFADNGIGFESKYKDQIFELFQRLHSKHEFSGSGIGLSIVKRIVDRHHGFIDVTSEVGKGACFTVWLPASRR